MTISVPDFLLKVCTLGQRIFLFHPPRKKASLAQLCSRYMVFTAYLICIAGLLGSLGHCDNSYICKAQDRLQEVPQAHVWKVLGGHFCPFTFCKRQRENAANGRDFAVYDQRWNRKLGQIIGAAPTCHEWAPQRRA